MQGQPDDFKPVKDVVLLGAGASVGAGVPSAVDMTESLVGYLHSEEARHLVAFILGRLLARRGEAGRVPVGKDQKIDVEELINAVKLLSQRHSSELSAFVYLWHPRLEQLDVDPLSMNYINEFIESLSSVTDGLRVDRFCKAVRAVVGLPGEGTLVASLEVDLLRALSDIVWIRNETQVRYLAPLLKPLDTQEQLVVATLNYDNAIEVLAKAEGIDCNIGLETWNKRGDFDTSTPGLHLLKLHGSIDWEQEEDSLVSRCPGPSSWPLLVFGGGNKLTARGPFLDLLLAFRRALASATRLTIIGYSFRDQHINLYIHNWARTRPDREVRVLAPDASSHNISREWNIKHFDGTAEGVLSELFRE